MDLSKEIELIEEILRDDNEGTNQCSTFSDLEGSNDSNTNATTMADDNVTRFAKCIHEPNIVGS